MQGEQGSAPMHGGRRLFGSSGGRMEGPFGLEDRMRYAQKRGVCGRSAFGTSGMA